MEYQRLFLVQLTHFGLTLIDETKARAYLTWLSSYFLYEIMPSLVHDRDSACFACKEHNLAWATGRRSPGRTCPGGTGRLNKPGPAQVDLIRHPTVRPKSAWDGRGKPATFHNGLRLVEFRFINWPHHFC
jgi:hypothetical protein